MAQNKVKIGIIFGGQSKEREISFAGGRTVYDNLNKSIFEAIPIFVDSFGNFVELKWEFIYKGTIRDFYPPVEFLPAESHFQYYAENLGNLSTSEQEKLVEKIGKKISVPELKTKIDFAFLCLHGPYGEDGRIQGLFEYYQIPYSGSGVLPSSIGIDKSVQKRMMVDKGFNSPNFLTIDRAAWINGMCKGVFAEVKSKIGFPCVVKPANQGSSIGISVLSKENETAFMYAVEKALFTYWLDVEDWKKKNDEEKLSFAKKLTDIREGIGMPILVSIFPDNQSLTDEKTIYDPDALLNEFNSNFKSGGMMLQSMDGESTVLVEGFIEGKEFSCIVVENEKGTPIALPPTEIKKGKELFDYRSKYLPGLSRKITPIDLPDAQIEAIRKDCERLFLELKFDVYARIDGFLSTDGKIFLNDPNTTSGMMPSSFFFHQAAEIGLSPSEFLSFIISTSLRKRIIQAKGNTVYKELELKLEGLIHKESNAASYKTKVAVILGGYSSERHISVESGRNV
nr:D-alanine--D-alanine ligase [Bacteroidia bacterium]